MKKNRAQLLLVALAAIICFSGTHPAAGQQYRGSAKDRLDLQKTGDAIRSAFARGDVDAIMAYHHPDVIKALRAGEYQTGAEEVRKALVETFAAFTLQFDQSHVDNLFFQGDTAVEESTFAIRGTPKKDGQPFLFRGRSLVVYVRYTKSPTGWASIREIIQPAP